MKILNFIKRFFRRKSALLPKSQGMPSNGRFAQLIQMVDETLREEYDCAQVYELLDQFAEMVTSGEDASLVMPLVDQHLKMCPDCREEYEALLRMLAGAYP